MSFTPSAATTRLLAASTGGNPTLPISAVWNSAGTTFTGIKFNVTDTASAAGSLLMDLQVGGVNRFYVGKDSQFRARASSNQEVNWDGRYFRLTRNTSTFPSFTIAVDSTYAFKIASPGSINWTGGTSDDLSDVSLFRDATNTLAQRRGGNPQTFRVYNTYTDASNYERGRLEWASNTFRIGTQAAGTGTLRDTEIFGASIQFHAGGSYRWFIQSSGNILASSDNSHDIGQAGTFRPRNLFLGSYVQRSEMTAPAAPAANSVRIYAVDNGSGKTQLMALFATGAAQQIAIEP